MNAKDKVLEKKTKISTEQLRFAISTANTPELKKSRGTNKRNMGKTWSKGGSQNIRARRPEPKHSREKI